MRHGTPNRRSRNKGHHGGNNGGQHNGQRRGAYNRNQIFDSNGPDVRIRGTAHQVCEKYLALAKDAASAGDSILAESYLQHAEHYQRIINSWNEEFRDVNRPHQSFAPQSQESSDDLALPMSILGGDVKPASETQESNKAYEGVDLLETA